MENSLLVRMGNFAKRPFVGGRRWIRRLRGRRGIELSAEYIEMEPLTEQRSLGYAAVSFEDLLSVDARAQRAASDKRDDPAADVPDSPVPAGLIARVCAWVFTKALKLLPDVLKRAPEAAQRFLFRRTCSRLRRLLVIGWATLLWGMLIALVSTCGFVLDLMGELDEILDGATGKWLAQYGTYVMPYFTVLHVAQVIGGVFLLFAVKNATESPLHPRNPAQGTFLFFVFLMLGITFPKDSPSCSETSHSTPVSLPQHKTAVLQVRAHMDHNLDGQKRSVKSRPSIELPDSGKVSHSSTVPLAGTSTDLFPTSVPQISQTNEATRFSEVPLSQTSSNLKIRPEVPSLVDKNMSSLEDPLKSMMAVPHRSSAPADKVPATPTAPSMSPSETARSSSQSLPANAGGSPTRSNADGRARLTKSFSLEEEVVSVKTVMEELPEEDMARKRKTTLNAPLSCNSVLLKPWLWVSALTFATYTVTSELASDDIVIPATFGSATAIATYCILDVLAEFVGVPECNSHCKDIDSLFDDTGLSYESIQTTVQKQLVTTNQKVKMRDFGASPATSGYQPSEVDEMTNLLQR